MSAYKVSILSYFDINRYLLRKFCILSLVMMSFARFYIFVFIIILNTEINTLDLCTFSNENSTVVDSYLWKNQSSKNCGCQNCIRKCCKPGYFRILDTGLCYKNSTEYTFNVPVYIDDTRFVKVVKEINDFIIGPICCEYFNYPSDDFYVQTDGTVWIPTFNRYFYNNQYCVDESNGFTLLLCLPPEKVLLSVVGTYNYSLTIIIKIDLSYPYRLFDRK